MTFWLRWIWKLWRDSHGQVWPSCGTSALPPWRWSQLYSGMHSPARWKGRSKRITEQCDSQTQSVTGVKVAWKLHIQDLNTQSREQRPGPVRQEQVEGIQRQLESPALKQTNLAHHPCKMGKRPWGGPFPRISTPWEKRKVSPILVYKTSVSLPASLLGSCTLSLQVCTF